MGFALSFFAIEHDLGSNGISINGPFSEGRVTFGVTLSFTHELEIFVDMHVKWNQSVGMKMVAC